MAAPIKNTCPDIDKLLKRIKNLRGDLKQIPEEEADIRWLFDNIDSELYTIAGEMEDLRSSNETLREWGKEMEEEAESLQVQLSELEEKLELTQNHLTCNTHSPTH
jgi:predicted nuclease with TOPRIM domain